MKVRFAPSPTGSLHIGNALGAVANRNFGGSFLLRIDDPDPARNVEGGEQAILDDLRWLGIEWDEGPVRQRERGDRYREAAAGLPERFQGVQLLRPDGSATYQLASVVDDIDFGITHVIRGSDHRPNEPLHRALTEALGATAPEYIHLGLILGPDGKQLSRRSEGASVASLRDAGIPPEAVRRYLEELGTPRFRARRRCEGSMRLFDTYTKSLVELPPPPGPVRMYFCGPTVYARAHIGNARPFVVGMWLRSWLAQRGYDVTLVHNITDVNG